MNCSIPGFSSFYLQTISQSSLKFMYIESVILSNHLILCCPLLLLPSIFHGIKVFSNESAVCIRWPKYWRFSFSINLSSDYSALISFWIDWFDLLELMQLSFSPCMDFSSCGNCQLLWLVHASVLVMLVDVSSGMPMYFNEHLMKFKVCRLRPCWF